MIAFNHLFLDDDYPFLTPRERETHTYVIGQPGVGKSRAIESWVMQDILKGNGVGVIDPHGDLYHNLTLRLVSRPEVWNRIVMIDPCNPKWVTPFNPLEAVPSLSSERLALFLTDIIGKIWKMDLTSAPRMMWLLSNSFLALTELKLTLLDLPRFLLDSDYRENLLPQISHTGAYSFFQNEYPKSQGAVLQWASPVLNKIGSLIFDPDLSLMMVGKSKVSFRNIMDNRLILLVNLPKGIVGDGASALLGAFIVAHIQKAALARADTNQRVPFYLYLDEFQNYTTDNIKDILSEARKYCLSMTLANQYLNQLSPDIRSAILNTAGSIACFRVGSQDGISLAREIFPSPDFLATPMDRYKVRLPGFLSSMVFRNQADISGWDSQAQVLTRLPAREFWFRRRGLNDPVRYKTLDMSLPKKSPDTREQLEAMFDVSGRLYGRLKSDVRQDINQRYQPYPPSTRASTGSQGSRINDNDSLWSV